MEDIVWSQTKFKCSTYQTQVSRITISIICLFIIHSYAKFIVAERKEIVDKNVTIHGKS
jgi:hypothetical protein